MILVLMENNAEGRHPQYSHEEMIAVGKTECFRLLSINRRGQH